MATDVVGPFSPVSVLGLSARAFNVLMRSGITTVGQVEQCCEHDLYDLRNAGVKTVSEIKAALAKHGRSLRGDEHEPQRPQWTPDVAQFVAEVDGEHQPVPQAERGKLLLACSCRQWSTPVEAEPAGWARHREAHRLHRAEMVVAALAEVGMLRVVASAPA